MSGTFTKVHEGIGDVETVAIIAVVGLVAYGIWRLAQAFPQVKSGQVAPKPTPLAQAYPSTNPNVPLNLGPLTLGSTMTAQQYESSLENVPVVGNGLAQVFSSAYGAGAQAGNNLKSLLTWNPPSQLNTLSQELGAWSANIVANRLAGSLFSSSLPATVGQVRALLRGYPIGGH